MPTSHTDACQAATVAHQRAVEAHAAKFPNACQRCHGAGGKAFGGTREEPPDYEECEACLGQCRCPGCGAAEPIFKAWADGVGPFTPGTCQPTLKCPACGWTHDGSGAVPDVDADEPTKAPRVASVPVPRSAFDAGWYEGWEPSPDPTGARTPRDA